MNADRVAVVTGGTRGIGLGIATALARRSFDLAIGGRRSEADVADVLDQLRSLGAEVLYHPGDVSERATRDALVAAVMERFDRLDVLVNNAGIAPPVRADILEASEESYDLVMNVNLKGPYFLSQAVARLFRAQHDADASFAGSIINIGSVSAEMASTNRGEYCLSRAATDDGHQTMGSTTGRIQLHRL